MVSTHDELPKDTESLHRLLIDARQCIAQRDEQLRIAEAKILYSTLEIEDLKMQLTRLRRLQFGRSSEKLSEAIEQIEFTLEELESSVSVSEFAAVSAPRPPRPARKLFPAAFPRQIITHDVGCTCSDFNISNGLPILRKTSAHGLGHLLDPLHGAPTALT